MHINIVIDDKLIDETLRATGSETRHEVVGAWIEDLVATASAGRHPNVLGQAIIKNHHSRIILQH